MNSIGWEISIWIVWFIIAIILLIVEFSAPGIFAIFFSIGAFIAGISSFFIDSYMVQLAIFVFTSLIVMIFGKRSLEKLLNVNKEIRPSTIDAFRGKMGVVTKRVTPIEKGLVKINGEEWTAKTTENLIFDEGERVEIVSIEGVTVLIKKYKEGV